MADHQAWFAAGGRMESGAGGISPRSARVFSTLTSWRLRAVIPRSGPLMGGGAKRGRTLEHAVEPGFRLIQAILLELTFRAARIADRQARAFMNHD